MTTFVTRPYDPTAANVLTTAGYLPPVARALSARGIRSPEDLNEAWSGMLPPNLLTGIDRAAERLLAARNRGERVTIVADYDCDGATACAVGIRGLSALGLSVDYFVPDRVRHGYGLTAAIVDLLAARPNPPQVILTVDNGISSADAVRHAAAAASRRSRSPESASSFTCFLRFARDCATKAPLPRRRSRASTNSSTSSPSARWPTS